MKLLCGLLFSTFFSLLFLFFVFIHVSFLFVFVSEAGPAANSSNKIEPQSPLSRCKTLFEGLDLLENPIRFYFPDLNSTNKLEARSPISCCKTLFESQDLEENCIRVDFPDLKHVYFKAQSRVNRTSKQRILEGRIKVRVTSRAPQIQSIDVYVDRTPDASVLVGSGGCGRVYLKPKPGSHYLNKVKRRSYGLNSSLRFEWFLFHCFTLLLMF